LLRQFLVALEKVTGVLEQYEVLEIPHREFPYRSVMVPRRVRDPRYGGVAFLARDAPETFSIDNLSFYYQCTIGFMLKDSIEVFTELAEKYYGAKDKQNEILPLVQQAQSLPTSNKRLQAYLFLFLYSASTRHHRKDAAVFVLRHAFQDLRKAITAEELETLIPWMKNNSSQDDDEYFHRLHVDPIPRSQQQKYSRQFMWDVGRVPYRPKEDRVFVEYRGFQALLNHRVGSGPKSIKRIREALKTPQGA
jgi:hypothetical protein